MKISTMQNLLDAKVLCCEEKLEGHVYSACGCDLMSDVLAYVKDSNGVLLTGLANPQVVRTAAMMDMSCIVLVRNKTPDEKTVELAKQNDMVVLKCKNNMYTACGLLFGAGMRGDQ